MYSWFALHASEVRVIGRLQLVLGASDCVEKPVQSVND